MNFKTINRTLFWTLNKMSISPNYTTSEVGICWKFWFSNNLGIMLIKHIDWTENDLWSVVAVTEEDREVQYLDEIRYNVTDEEVIDYAKIIKKWLS